MLLTVIEGWEFETMCKGARAFHDHVDRLDEEARVQLDESIYGRLRRSSNAPGPPQGHWKLADEIVALLENPRLSHDQAKELEDTYFGAAGLGHQ